MNKNKKSNKIITGKQIIRVMQECSIDFSELDLTRDKSFATHRNIDFNSDEYKYFSSDSIKPILNDKEN